MQLRHGAFGGVFCLLLTACSGHPVLPPSAEIDEVAFRAHVQTLASDEFAGRKPATAGEEKTVAYLVDQFKSLGLKPGNGASFIQPVPLVEITADRDAYLKISSVDLTRTMTLGTDAVIWTKRVQAAIEVRNSEIVFVGYGIVAPEYAWNDYDDVDVRGKTVVVLVNDPGFASGDPGLFKGRTMTYYGRWTYKFEEAARHGAAAVLIVHNTAAAGYGWEVVKNSWSGPQLDRVTADNNAGRPALEGWVSDAAATQMFAQAKLDFRTLAAAAGHRGFRAQVLPLRAAADIHNSIRYSNSANVVALLPGTSRRKEFVFFTAHWDHFGTRSEAGDTQIFHGAVDNASGVAGVITLAQSFVRSAAPRARSLVFMCVTAEESGLLGSAYYVEHPLFPLRDTVADINLDSMHIGGPTRDVAVVGFGNSDLEDVLRTAAAFQGREIHGESEPEQGHFFRSDHFSFAKVGVPALFASSGIDDAEHGPIWGQQQLDDFTEHRYHKPTDVYSPDWDLRGTLQDLRLYFAVGEHVANQRRIPNWYSNSEFRAVREKDRAP